MTPEPGRPTPDPRTPDRPSPRPRRLARRLLQKAVGSDLDTTLGDLHEAWTERRAGVGAFRAWFWYWRQVLSVRWHGASPTLPGRADRLRPGLAMKMALRGIRREPATALIAAVTLALGLAFSTTLYGFLSGATRDLPVPDGHAIVRVEIASPQGVAPPIERELIETWRGGSGSLSGLGAFRMTELTFDDADGYARRYSAAEMSVEAFDLLRVPPVLGRTFVDGDVDAGALLLGYDLWQEAFGGDPGVLGREVRSRGRMRTIVGVMPPDFGFPLAHDAWVPLPDRKGVAEPDLMVVGRLAAGASPETAQTEMQVAWERRDAQRPAEARGARVQVAAFTGGRGEGGEAVAFAALASIVLSLLVVACLNTSTLLLVRAARRRRLVGIQTALGAGRLQVAAQAFLEAALIALAGGALGLVFTKVAIDWADRALAVHFGYFWMHMAVDVPVLVFATVLVTGAALVAGTAPALRAARSDPHEVLQGSVRGSGGGLGRLAGAFIGMQVTAATVSLAGAMLMAVGLASWGGFLSTALPEQPILVVSYDSGAAPGEPSAESVPDLADFEQRLLEEPSLAGAALAMGALGFGEAYAPFEVDGPRDADEPVLRAGWNAVTAGYFDLFELPVVEGRALPDASAGEPRVAVVSRSFAAHHLAGEAIGRQVRVEGATGTEWATVVGVVENVRASRDDERISARIYFPRRQVPARTGMLLVPVREDAAATGRAIRAAAHRADPDLPLQVRGTLAEFFAYLGRMPRVIAGMGISGAAAGLLVMAVGLYGLLAFYVRQHLFELGVRIAMGADTRAVTRVVLGRAARMMLPGVLAGCALMYGVAPLFGTFLFGAEPRAPLPFILVVVTMTAVGLLAAAGPLRRALRVAPADVLRAE